MNSNLTRFFVTATLVILPGALHAQATAVPARINDDRINIRKGPGEQYERFVLLDAETPVTALARQGEWVKVRVPGGQTGWVGRKFLLFEKPLPAARPAPKPAPAPARAAAPALRQATVPAPAPAAAKNAQPTGALAGTRPDPLDRTQDSPAATVGDAGRLLIVLIPVLGLIVLGIRGLKAFYERNGGLPDLKRGLMGGFNLNRARVVGGSNIRVIESVPVGSFGLHLVQVRGRQLLLGSTSSQVSLLTEFKENESAPDGEFGALLSNAAAEMDDDLLDESSLASMMGSLDDSIRDAREIITRRMPRARTWSEGDEDHGSTNR